MPLDSQDKMGAGKLDPFNYSIIATPGGNL
jgi:hypothetical protein